MSRIFLRASLVAAIFIGSGPASAGPTSADIAREVVASKLDHRAVKTFSEPASIDGAVVVQKAGVSFTAGGDPCFMWFGNLGGIGRTDSPLTVTLGWQNGRDRLFPNLAGGAATRTSHCAVDTTTILDSSVDAYHFADVKTRDNFFWIVIRTFRAWHHQFPSACYAPNISYVADADRSGPTRMIGTGLCSALLDPLMRQQ